MGSTAVSPQKRDGLRMESRKRRRDFWLADFTLITSAQKALQATLGTILGSALLGEVDQGVHRLGPKFAPRAWSWTKVGATVADAREEAGSGLEPVRGTSARPNLRPERRFRRHDLRFGVTVASGRSRGGSRP